MIEKEEELKSQKTFLVRTHTHAHTHTRIHTYIHTYTHITHSHTHMHTHTHTQKQQIDSKQHIIDARNAAIGQKEKVL